MATAEPGKKGAFIVIEGLDRSGKTTQVQRLSQALVNDGEKVKPIRFPDRTTSIGQMINQYLQSKSELEDHVIHLLFSANRWEIAKKIEADVAAGYVVICDRYYYSGMIYSAAKGNPTLSLAWARDPEVGLPRPSMVVFLDLDPEEAERRGGFGDEKYENKVMQKKVREGFHFLRDCDHEESEDMIVIDAKGTQKEVGEKILKHVKEKILHLRGKAGNIELGKVSKW